MKKGIFGLIMILSLAMVIIAGCGGGGGSTTVGPTPTPIPAPEEFPDSTTAYQTSGPTFFDSGYALTDTVVLTGDDGSTWGDTRIDDAVGALGTLATYSDGANKILYVKVTFSKTGVGRQVCLLVDDTAQTSNFPVNGRYTQYLPWLGSFDLRIPNFDPDLGVGAEREWGPGTLKSNIYQFYYDGSSQVQIAAPLPSCSVNGLTHDGGGNVSSIEFQIPYDNIGKNGAVSGANLKLVAILGRGVYASDDGTLVTARPLGASSAIPGDQIILADPDTDAVRIGTIGSYAKCALE